MVTYRTRLKAQNSSEQLGIPWSRFSLGTRSQDFLALTMLEFEYLGNRAQCLHKHLFTK